MIGFGKCIGSVLKLAKESEDTENQEEALVKKIMEEVCTVKTSEDYDLGDFTRTKIIEQTSPTLLRLVSKLVSWGEYSTGAIVMNQWFRGPSCYSWTPFINLIYGSFSLK